MSTATAQVFNLPEREFQQAIAEMLGRGEYRRVLDAVRFARERDPKNIFLIAIDRQVRRLEELITTDDPEIDERTKTEESLVQLIQRAWADATTRGVVLTLPADAVAAVDAGAIAPRAASAPAQQPVAQGAPQHAKGVSPAPAAAPTQSTSSAAVTPPRKIPASLIAAALLTIAIIGMGITYFVTRKAERPEPVTVISTLPPAQVVPEAGNPESSASTAPEEKSPAPVSEAPGSTARRRSQQTAAGSRQAVEQSQQPAREPSKSVPPAAGRSEPGTKSVAGLGSPPPPRETVAAPPEAESAEPFIPVQKEPRVLRLVEPEIGEAAFRHGREGEIVARVLIGTDGKALKVRIVKSTNTFLNKAVAEALLKSEYEPGVMTAGPVQSWLTVPFKFR